MVNFLTLLHGRRGKESVVWAGVIQGNGSRTSKPNEISTNHPPHPFCIIHRFFSSSSSGCNIPFAALFAILHCRYDPQIVLGGARPLTQADLMPLPDFLTSAEVFATFKQCWALESMRLATVTSGFARTTTAAAAAATAATAASAAAGSAPPRPRLWRVLHEQVSVDSHMIDSCY